MRDNIGAGNVGKMHILMMVLSGLVMLVDGFDTQSISYVMPRLAEEWHLSRGAVGPILSAGLFGSVIGDCGIVLLSPRIGHKRLLLVDMMLFAVAMLITGWARTVAELLVCRFITGLALGAAVPSLIALASEYLPERRRASGILLIYACYSIGFVVAGVVAAIALPRYGWRSLFVIGALAPLPLLVAIAAWMPESLLRVGRSRDTSRGVAKKRRRMSSPPATTNEPVLDTATYPRHGIAGLFVLGTATGTLLLWTMLFLNTGQFYFLQSWLPTMLSNLYYSPTRVALITALTTVGGALSVLLIGPAMDRHGPYLTLLVLFCAAGLAVACVGPSLTWPAAVMMSVTFIAGLCVSGGQKGLIALTASFYPAAIRAVGIGWALGIGRIGGSLGTMLVGLMYTAHWPLQQIFIVAATPMLAMLLCVEAMRRRYRLHAQAPPPPSW